ncbi:unnamed protein product, partial [Amoebophrya sp. A120]
DDSNVSSYHLVPADGLASVKLLEKKGKRNSKSKSTSGGKSKSKFLAPRVEEEEDEKDSIFATQELERRLPSDATVIAGLVPDSIGEYKQQEDSELLKVHFKKALPQEQAATTKG